MITGTPLIILLVMLGVVLGIVAIVYLAAPVFQGIAWILRNIGRGIAWFFSHIFRFVFGMFSDLVRSIGGVITAIVFVPLIVGNVLIGRWSAASHFGRAFQDEIRGVGHCLYRVVIGHPAKFLLLGGLVEGIEQRIPQAVAQSPGSDKPAGRANQFEGYKVVGSLPGGGSGGRLYVAEPDERKSAAFARSGRTVTQVVIKAFSLSDGSSLPQIIRESRALEAAKKLGLILDHELTDARFYYVMEYIPGDSLTLVTKRLHSESGAEGLSNRQLFPAMSMIADLLRELDRYHHGGLWHKDVKPDNIIINQGRAHLVDLGLVTPLRSAMTLTTHGTEYFRDPELVRMALRGAKVNEVDGVKFDLYGVGAVLYSVIENSFPAHGGLSQITRSCPEALRWIVRRAMTDLNNRYASAGEMLADLGVVLASNDPFMLRPADLPSVAGGAVPPPIPADDIPARPGAPVAAAAPEKQGFIFDVQYGVGAPKSPDAPPSASRLPPKISVTDWWSGRYSADPAATPQSPAAGSFAADASRAAAAAAEGIESAARAVRQRFAGASIPPRGPGKTAAEQLSSARARVQAAQERIHSRMSRSAYSTPFARTGKFNTKPNPGVAAAFFIFLAVAVAIPMFLVVVNSSKSNRPAPPMPTRQIEIDSPFGKIRLNRDEQGISIDQKTIEAFKALGKDWTSPADGPVEINIEGDSEVAEMNKIGRKFSEIAEHFRGRAGSGPASSAPDSSATPLPPPPPEASHGSNASSTTEADAIAQAEFVSGRILFLSMLQPDVDPIEHDTTRGLASRLRSMWFEVLGDAASGDDTELLAAARRVVELSTPEDPDAAERVQAWLNDPATGLDAMLWIGEGSTPGSVVRRIFFREGFDGATLVAALVKQE